MMEVNIITSINLKALLCMTKILAKIHADNPPYPTGFDNPFGDSMFLALRTLFLAACGIGVVYCGYQMIVSTDDRMLSRARAWLAAIIMAAAAAILLPGIIESVANISW